MVAAEDSLVERLRRGDGAAFDEVYGTYQPRLYSFLLRLSGRRDTAEDLAQETWLRLAKAAPNLRPDTVRKAYILQYAPEGAYVRLPDGSVVTQDDPQRQFRILDGQ